MQVEHVVPVAVGLVVLLELELERVEVLEHLGLGSWLCHILFILDLCYVFILIYYAIKFINHSLFFSCLLLFFYYIVSNLFDHLALTLALSFSPFCYNYYD